MSFGEGLQQGEAVAESAINNWRKGQAMHALENVYGPIAADPELAQKNENYLQSTKMAPGALQAQSLANQGTQLDNAAKQASQNASAAYRAAQMLKTQANPDGTIPPDAFDKIITPNAAQFGIDPAHIAPLKALLSQPGGADQLDKISQALLGPAQMKGSAVYGTDANGNPVELQTMANGAVRQVPLAATPTVVANSGFTGARVQQGATRLGIQQQNANTAQLRARTTANNSTYGPGDDQTPVPTPAPAATPTLPTGGMSPQAMDKFIADHGGIDGALAATANTPQGDKIAQALADHYSAGLKSAQPAAPAEPQPLYNTLPPKGRQLAIGQASALANQKTTLGNMNSILDQVDKQIGPFTSGAYSKLSDIPGTAATDLKANLKTLSAMGLTTWLNSLKNSQGQTGIGRVLQSEANAAMTLYGNMEQDQSPAQLAYHARLFRQTVQGLYSHATQGFRKMYGVDPSSIIGDEPKPAAGKTLSDADLLAKYGVK